MIDVTGKARTLRTAKAKAELKIQPGTARLIRSGDIPKGDPFTVAEVAAVQAVKGTSGIVPYCHSLPIEYAGVEFEMSDNLITMVVEVKAVHRTGVEMEALTGASVAALTLYDMLKMVDDSMEIRGIRLLEKQGGKFSFREDLSRQVRATVIVLSDSVSEGLATDRSGRLIVERLEEEAVQIEDYVILPDDPGIIRETLLRFSDELGVDLILTTGGTGFSPRDRTPEVMNEIIEREAPGIPEALRSYGQERIPHSMLSRGRAGIRGKTVIINLPGSKKGVVDCLRVLFPGVLHAFKMLWMEESSIHSEHKRESE